MSRPKTMRTSLEISITLLKKAKHAAVEEERPLRAIVVDALEQYLRKPRKVRRGRR